MGLKDKKDQRLIPSVATRSVFPDMAVKSEFVGENDGESAKVLIPTSDRLLEPCPLLDRMADRGPVQYGSSRGWLHTQNHQSAISAPNSRPNRLYLHRQQSQAHRGSCT
jgi:hypothetical protein